MLSMDLRSTSNYPKDDFFRFQMDLSCQIFLSLGEKIQTASLRWSIIGLYELSAWSTRSKSSKVNITNFKKENEKYDGDWIFLIKHTSNYFTLHRIVTYTKCGSRGIDYYVEYMNNQTPMVLQITVFMSRIHIPISCSGVNSW